MIRVAATFLCVGALLAAPALLSSFHITLLNYIGIYTLVVLGLLMLTGWSGVTSFGQAAFFGLGAYAAAWFTTAYGGSPWVALLLSITLTGGSAVVLGLVSLPLPGHYLPLMTIIWGMALHTLFGTINMLGRQSGISQIPAVEILGYSFQDMHRFFYLIWTVVLLSLLGTANLMQSREGRALRALKAGRVFGESVGVSPFRLRLTAFVIAAVLAAVAGWLYAFMQRYVSPGPFGLLAGIEFVLMTVIGGSASVIGALVGASVLTLLRNFLQDFLPYLTDKAGNLEIVVFGVLFIVVLQNTRRGIVDVIVGTFWLWRPSAVAAPVAANVAAGSFERRPMPETGTELLRVEGLTRRFGGLVAVNDVSFTVRAGETFALIGPNGAGKSTLFNVVCGALKPTEGRVFLRGEEITGERPAALVRRGVARTFQHIKLNPEMTVLENVILGCYSRSRAGFLAGSLRLDRQEDAAARAEALAQLTRVGLADKQRLPAGTLPLGQQRLVEVARALAADPQLIMLDEPAAGLRLLEKDALSNLLRALKVDGVTVLIIEHDMSFVMGLVDRIVVVYYGAKLTEGVPAEIRSNEAVQEAYLGGIS